LEDLWGFNEEIVADAIYEAKTPIVSAVGHEIDFLISDFTADLRAPTPSAAMELILPDINEIRMFIDSLMNSYNTHLGKILDQKSKILEHQFELFRQNSYESKIEIYKNEIKNLKKSFDNFFTLSLNQKQNTLEQLKQAYALNDPAKKDKTGFAQISQNGKLISLEKLKEGDMFLAQSPKVEITAEVKKTRKLT